MPAQEHRRIQCATPQREVRLARLHETRRGIRRMRSEVIRPVLDPLHRSVRMRREADAHGHRARSIALARLLESVGADRERIALVDRGRCRPAWPCDPRVSGRLPEPERGHSTGVYFSLRLSHAPSESTTTTQARMVSRIAETWS